MSDNFWPALLALAISATGFMFLAQKYIPRRGQTFVPPDELKRRLDEGEDIVVLDVRNPGEFNAKPGHIPGAVNLSIADFKARMDEIRGSIEPYKNQPVFVVCRFENRSPAAANMLKKEGFSDVSILKGGFMGWCRKGLPVEMD